MNTRNPCHACLSGEPWAPPTVPRAVLPSPSPSVNPRCYYIGDSTPAPAPLARDLARCARARVPLPTKEQRVLSGGGRVQAGPQPVGRSARKPHRHRRGWSGHRRLRRPACASPRPSTRTRRDRSGRPARPANAAPPMPRHAASTAQQATAGPQAQARSPCPAHPTRARRHAEGFGWSDTVDRLLDVYEDAVAERSAVNAEPLEVAR